MSDPRSIGDKIVGIRADNLYEPDGDTKMSQPVKSPSCTTSNNRWLNIANKLLISGLLAGTAYAANSDSQQSQSSPKEAHTDEAQASESIPPKGPHANADNSQAQPQQNAAAERRASTPVAAGPDRPIGHSLRTPEAQRRIEIMMAKAQQNGKVGPLVPAPAPASHTQKLVGGTYGFEHTGDFVGVPKALVSLGSSTPAYGLVVEKLHHRMSLFKTNDKNEIELVKTYRAITGRDPGDKLARGDLRTPEGIYFVTGRLDDDELPAKYGRMAFTLDYPNIYDKRKRKSGYGIWIHATDDADRLKKPFDTEGCVVVSNEDIIDLEKRIAPFEVPVVITKEMSSAQPTELESTRQKALEMVEAWRNAWQSSSFDSYMSYYSKNFRSLGKNKKQWEQFKAGLGEMRGDDIRVTISEPKVVAFEDQLLVVFLQDYQSQQHSDFGRKFLYLQWEGDRYRIIAEKWYKSPRTETALRALKTATKSL